MSNFQSQKKQSGYERDILIDFLMSKGFIGEMRMTSSYIELSNDRKVIEIPNIDFLTEAMTKDVLQNSGLSFSEFEEHLDCIENFKSMIDLGISTNPRKD